MNHGQAVCKHVQSPAPKPTPVALAMRKKKDCMADQQEFGIRHQQSDHALNGDSDSDSFPPIQEDPLHDVLVGAAETLKNFHLDKNDSEGPAVALGVAENTLW